MSSENPSPETQSASKDASSEKPARSKIERALVWTVIIALVALTGMEALAQRGYSKSLEDLETAIADAKEPLTLNDFETAIKSGFAIKSNATKEKQDTILFKWPSLLRRYEIHFTLAGGDEQILDTYSTNDDPPGMIPRPSDGTAETDDATEGMGPGMPGAHDDGTGQPGGGGPGFGGGGPGGGNRRNPLERLLAGDLVEGMELSDEQKTKIQELIDNQQPPEEGLSREERFAQFRAAREAMMEKLKEILEAEQFEKVNAALESARRNRPQRPQGEGSGRPQRPE